MGLLSTFRSWYDGGSAAPVEKGVFDIDGGVGAWTSVGGNSGPSPVSLKAAAVLNRSLTPVECYELSISVRRAVDAIARNASQAKPRLFTGSGREITGGPLFDIINRPYPLTMWDDWAYRWYSFCCVTGEGAAWAFGGDGMTPSRLRMLNPLRLDIKDPKTPNERQDVAQWKYRFPNGHVENIPDTKLVFDPAFTPNPDVPVRGLSPLATAATHAEIGYFSALYNKTFFQNDSIPQGMLVLPDGLPRNVREDMERKYLSQFKSDHLRHNWHKQLVVSGGKEVRFEPIEQPFQDGAFMESQKYSDEKIGQAFGVPPIEMHNLAKTRFDTADDERRMFAETTIQFHLGRLQRTIQTQLIDPYFSLSEYSTDTTGMSKSLAGRFEKARQGRGAGSIVLLLDADTMPIMVSVRASIIESAKAFRETTMASPDATNRYFNIELDDPENDDVRKEVWAQNNIACLSDPSRNAQLTPGVKPGGGEPGGDGPPKPAAAKPKPKKELSPEDKNRVSKAKRVLFDLRSLALAKMQQAELYGLLDADALNTGHDEAVKREIRVIRHALRKICEDEGLGKDAKVEAAKDWFARYKPPHIRKMLGL
jgi:HK97 family phage portal protein